MLREQTYRAAEFPSAESVQPRAALALLATVRRSLNCGRLRATLWVLTRGVVDAPAALAAEEEHSPRGLSGDLR